MVFLPLPHVNLYNDQVRLFEHDRALHRERRWHDTST